MAITQRTGLVNTGGSAAASLAFTLGSQPSAGQTAFVLISGWSAAVNFPANGASDNRGNTWAQAVYTDNDTGSPNTFCAIYYAKITATGSPFTITITPSASCYMSGAAIVADDIADSPLDRTASDNNGGSGSATPVTGTTLTTTQASELILAVLSVDGAEGSIGLTSGFTSFTQEWEDLNWSNAVGEGDSRYVAATGTYSCSWDMASLDNYAAVIATFKVAAAGAGGGVRPSTLTLTGVQ